MHTIEESVTFGLVLQFAVMRYHEKYGIDVHVPSTTGVWMVWITVCQGNTQFASPKVIVDQEKKKFSTPTGFPQHPRYIRIHPHV